MDGASPSSARQESIPGVTRATREAARTFVNDQSPNWMPSAEHPQREHGQDVQRTLQGLAIGTNSLPRPGYSGGDINSSSYGNNEQSNSADAGLSPDTAQSGSNRPTPNSSTPSEPHAARRAGSNSTGTSYETSPASSHQTHLSPDDRMMSSFFPSQPDYSGIPSSGLTPDNTFTMPETPGRDYSVPSGWEMNQQQNTGLTPVGEGVFRQLMGLGPMDPMELGWDGGS